MTGGALSGPAGTGLGLTVVGSGDAFGSGGRLNACFLLEAGGYRCLLDCGASSMVGIKRLGIDPASVSAILCTHFHGDHIGGIPFFVRDPRSARREQELVLAGPAGLESRVRHLTEGFFPGSSETATPLPLHYVELRPGLRVEIGPLSVEPFPVRHSAATHPHALRVEVAGRTVAYTGDTEWTDALYGLADGADLLIADGSALTPRGGHLDLETLAKHRPELRCGRLLLTHPGEEVLTVMDELDFEYAFDGMVVEV